MIFVYTIMPAEKRVERRPQTFREPGLLSKFVNTANQGTLKVMFGYLFDSLHGYPVTFSDTVRRVMPLCRKYRFRLYGFDQHVISFAPH